MRELHFCLTMDCERIEAESPPGGPPDWEFSERAIRGFHRLASAEGLRATFFIVPENAQRHQAMWKETVSEAFELGLHVHPQSLGDLRHKEYLGAYPREEQLDMLRWAAGQWQGALGAAPRVFRPGNASVNDETFSVLAELGFTHGSVSTPGRLRPDFRAVWSGAEPFAHRANRAFRLISGDMDFIEIPITEDLTRWRGTTKPNRALPYELRVEWGTPQEHRDTMDHAVEAMLAVKAPVFALVAITHNTYEYASDSCPQTESLRAMIASAHETARRFSLALRPSTLGDIRAAFLGVIR